MRFVCVPAARFDHTPWRADRPVPGRAARSIGSTTRAVIQSLWCSDVRQSRLLIGNMAWLLRCRGDGHERDPSIPAGQSCCGNTTGCGPNQQCVNNRCSASRILRKAPGRRGLLGTRLCSLGRPSPSRGLAGSLVRNVHRTAIITGWLVCCASDTTTGT